MYIYIYIYKIIIIIIIISRIYIYIYIYIYTTKNVIPFWSRQRTNLQIRVLLATIISLIPQFKRIVLATDIYLVQKFKVQKSAALAAEFRILLAINNSEYHTFIYIYIYIHIEGIPTQRTLDLYFCISRKRLLKGHRQHIHIQI